MSNTSRIAASRSSIAGTVAIFAFTVSFTHAQTNLKYQLPPKAIVDIVDANDQDVPRDGHSIGERQRRVH